MDSARLFLCARCRTQVVLCSRCDRGNWYCGRACSRQAREASRRQAGQRYQESPRGRAAHARRSRQWRQRTAAHAVQTDDAQAQDVTHQGCPVEPDAAPLAPCIDETTPQATATAPSIAQTATALPVAQRSCRRCCLVFEWLRSGFVRHAASRWRHDHLP